MPVKQGCCMVPHGRFFLGEYGGNLQATFGAGVLQPDLSVLQNQYFGLSESASINYTLEEIECANTDTRAGGLAGFTSYIKSAMFDFSVNCGTAETRALASLGAVREYASGTVTGEQHALVKNTVSAVSSVSKNTFVPLNYIPNFTVLPVVKNIAGTTTYVLGTDYNLADTGIEVLAAGTIVSGTAPLYAPTIQVDYTRADSQRMDAFLTIPKKSSILFDGFDRMSGAPLQTYIYNATGTAKANPIKATGLIKIDFSFRLQADPRIPYSPTSPTSQFFHQVTG
jgi:hypothetical protein